MPDVQSDGLGDQLTGDHVTYREHVAAKEATERRMAQIELEQAKLGASLMHIPEDVRALKGSIDALAQKLSTPQADQTMLAMHRLMDTVATKTAGGGGIAERLGTAIVFAAIGVAGAFLMGLVR